MVKIKKKFYINRIKFLGKETEVEKFMISPTALFYVPLIYYKHLYKASHKTNLWSLFSRHFTRSAKVYSSDFNAFSNKDMAIVNSVHK